MKCIPVAVVSLCEMSCLIPYFTFFVILHLFHCHLPGQTKPEGCGLQYSQPFILLFFVSSFFRLDEARRFVANFKGAGGCNLLAALKKVLQMKDIDSIVIVLGNW